MSFLGGEDLKNFITAGAFRHLVALLLFGAGFFIQLPFISAQEIPQDAGTAIEDAEVSENPLRVTEQAYTFGSNPAAQSTASNTSLWAMVRMLLVLALAAAAIYGIVFFIKKKTTVTAVAEDPFLKVIASSHLGNNRYAHIISAGNRAWLLGASDGGVNLISEIDDKDFINSMLLHEETRTAGTDSGGGFIALLRKMGGPFIPPEKQKSSADEIKKRRERLKQINN